MAVAPSNQRIWQKKLARQARLRFVGSLCAGLPEVVVQMQAVLNQMLAKPEDDSVHLHLALTAAAKEFENRQVWLDAANRRLRQSLLTGDEAAARATVPVTSFELVTDEAMEGKIIASRLTAQMMEELGSSFDGVRRVTQFLEGQDLLATDVLRPDTWCLRLIEAWEDAKWERGTLTLMRDCLLEQLGQLGRKAYEGIERFYEENNAATEEDLRSNRIKRSEGDAASPSHSAQAPGGAGAVAGSLGASAAAGLQAPAGSLAAGWGAMGAARQKASGVLAQLRGFLGGIAGHVVGGAAGGDSVSGGGAFAGGVVGGGGGFVSAGGGGVAAAGGPGSAAARAGAPAAAGQISPALQQALVGQPTIIQSAWFHTVPADYGNDPARIVAPVALAVRQQSSALKQVATSDEEKAIIEIIALMFQSILNEDRIPAGIRIWFARLQVPVLRVALAEPAFFNDTEHPARQLIDRMGACVLGFEAAALSGTALEAEVKRVVQVIEQYPETGSRVFQLVLKEFQKFLEKNLTEQAPKAQELVSLAQQVEQKETLAIQYTIQLRDMLLDMPVDSDIREFLFKHWSDVLAMSAIRFGAEHENTKKFKKAALDLVWSASAKPSKEERAKVIRQLPLLQTVLRQGLTLSNVVGENQDEMVKELMDIVAGAFLAKTNEIPPERIQAMAERLAHLEDALDEVVSPEYPLSAESIELMLGIDTSAVNVIADNDVEVKPEVLEWAKNLAIGNWFLLDHNGNPLQVQYVWHSQHKQLHLFAALSGQYFLFQLRRMGNYLQVGLLAPRDVEGITARAARDALAKIEANPERLLQ